MVCPWSLFGGQARESKLFELDDKNEGKHEKLPPQQNDNNIQAGVVAAECKICAARPLSLSLKLNHDVVLAKSASLSSCLSQTQRCGNGTSGKLNSG